jgi:hypothetical protein
MSKDNGLSMGDPERNVLHDALLLQTYGRY